MTCRDGIELDGVLAYWFAELPADQVEPFEDHQWRCEACTRRLAWIAAIGPALGTVLRRRGGVRIALTAPLVEHLAREGVRMRHYRPVGNQDLACSVSVDDDLVVSWFDVAPAADERVAIEMRGPGGAVMNRVDDLPVERRPDGRAQVILAEPGEVIRTLPSIVLQLRMIGIDPGGAERSLGDYTYRHTAIGG